MSFIIEETNRYARGYLTTNTDILATAKDIKR